MLRAVALRNRIKEFLDNRGMTAYQFWRAIGVAQTTAYRIYNDPTTIPKPHVLDAICKAFPGTQPGDLLEYVPDDIGNADLEIED
jgi:DNA-binding Xre family transcriptional regulator